MNILRLDFETRSIPELGGSKSVGLYNYMTHPSTRNLMLGYMLPGSNEVELWQPHLGEMPSQLRSEIKNPKVWISAYNSTFERYGLKFLCGEDVPVYRFLDPQVGARYLSLPADLDSVCEILDVPPALAKDKRGADLINLFSKPHKHRKKKGEAESELYFNDWESHPKEWQEFCEYCKRDILAEKDVERRMTVLQALPLPPFERKLWEWDQAVNDRGMPVDVQFVQKAYHLALRAKQEALDAQNKITGLDNSNSTTQLLPWVKARGYTYNTLNKNFVDAALKDPNVQLTPECREALTARRIAASTSYTKLAAILRQVCYDGRLRNQFIFMGSSRCGRWAGSAVQLHNLARPEVIGKSDSTPDGFNFEDIEVVNEARALVYGEKYNEIKAKYGNVLSVIKSLIRTVFVAPEEV